MSGTRIYPTYGKTANKGVRLAGPFCWHPALTLLRWIPHSMSASTRTPRGRFAKDSPRAPSFRWRRRLMVISGWARNSGWSASMVSKPSRGSRQPVSNSPAIGSMPSWLRATALFGLAQRRGLPVGRTASLREYPEVAGHRRYFTAARCRRNDLVWGQDPGRLCAVRVAKTQCYGAGSFGLSVPALYQDHKGNLWVSAQTGLWRWAPGPPEHYRLPDGRVQAKALIEGENGALLMATNKSGPFAGHG